MFYKVFDLIPGVVWAIVCAGLALLLGVQTMRYSHLDATHKAYKAEVTTATLESEQKARATEQSLRQQVERIAANAQERQTQLARRTADASAALAGLRDTIYRLDARPAAANSVAASVDHEARTARELLGACATEYRSVAEGADALRDQVTALQEYAASVSKHE